MKMILAMMVFTAVTAVGRTQDTACGVNGKCGQGDATVTYKYAVSMESQTGRVVKLSDDEYARLQKLRQAVVDAEIEIAKAHGVYFAPPTQHDFIACDRFDGCAAKPTDRYQFRGQFLLINLPKAAK